MRYNDLILKESKNYNNWVMHDQKTLEADFKEYKAKEEAKWENRASSHGFKFPIFDDFEEYVNAIKNGEVITIKGDWWDKITNLTQHDDIEDIKQMVSSYVFPRDVDRISIGIDNNDKIPYPVILKGNNGYFIMSGNTRLNVANAKGVIPKALLVDVSGE